MGDPGFYLVAYMFHLAYRVHITNGNSIRPAVFVRLPVAVASPGFDARRGTKRHAYNLSHAREITQNTATLCYKTIRCALSFFTARCYASAVLAMGLCLSVSLSVCLCLSVTSRSSTKTAKRRITQITPHDSTGPLVFRRQRSPRNSTVVTPYGGTKCRWGGSKSATFHK